MATKATPTAFFNRRMHSLLGLWLVIFLFEHLLTNSEAALFLGADGKGFISMVNLIHSIPYLQTIELLFIGIPFAVHIILGVKYLMTMKQNSTVFAEGTPNLSGYSRNHAYTWQRITSWLLIPLILFHVVQMRFLNYPETVKIGDESYHAVKVNVDPGVQALSKRIGVTLNNSEGTSQTLAISSHIGAAMLMNIRETFKSPLMLILYTIFVFSAVFHACNGLWTFALTWGLPLSMRGQNIVKRFALGIMALLLFLGLSAIWGSI